MNMNVSREPAEVPYTEYGDVQFIPPEPYENPNRQLFGYFPQLYAAHPEIIQGFQWRPSAGDTINISGAREARMNPRGADERVIKRTQRALDALHMGDASQAIYVAPDADDERIVILDHANMRQFARGERGYVFTAAAVFNNMDITEYAALLDCAWPLVVAFAEGKPPMIGFVHIGRRRALNRMPQRVMQALESYGYPAGQAYMCLPPSLEQSKHAVSAEDAAAQLGNVALWGKFIHYEHGENTYYPDLPGIVADGFLEAGIPPEHIEVYRVGTYEGAEHGFGGSYRHSTVTGQPGSAFLFGVQAPSN